MSLIEQLENVEKVIASEVKPCLKTKAFKGVMITTGWGSFEKDDEGVMCPIPKESPFIEIVANESIAVDEGDGREVTARVTLETCQDDGAYVHLCREKALDKKLCGITKDSTGSVGQWRWELARFYTERGDFQTEFLVTISLEDPCFVC